MPGAFFTAVVTIGCPTFCGTQASVAADSSLAQRASAAASSSGTRERSGLLGLGLGLEVPIIGAESGITSGPATYGYTFGGALSWEVTPRWLIRGFVTSGRAYGAHAQIQYEAAVSPSVTQQRLQQASWWSVELGAGIAYLLRPADEDWAPFIGVDGGAAFAGYEYNFAADDPLSQQSSTSASGSKPSDVHEALGWTWLATLRAGVRLSMLEWLATQAELGVSYLPVPAAQVTNTYTSLRVRSVAEPLWLVRATFSVRLGL